MKVSKVSEISKTFKYYNTNHHKEVSEEVSSCYLTLFPLNDNITNTLPHPRAYIPINLSIKLTQIDPFTHWKCQ